MERAIEFLACIQFLIIGLSHLLQPRVWVAFFIGLRERGLPGVFVNGFLSLLAGSLIVAFHNVWTGLPMILTLIGWAQVFKALTSFVVPQLGMRGMQRVSLERAWEFRVAGVIFLGLSGLMAYVLLQPAPLTASGAQNTAPSAPVEVTVAGPPVPFEDVGACPFEGCIYRDWIANAPLVVRADRRTDSPAVFALEKGEHAGAMTGVVVTLKPGRVEFRRAVDLQSSAGPIHVEPGETLYLLTSRGEGASAAWFKGRVYDEVDGSEFNGACGPNVVCSGTVIERPQSVWWIRLRNEKGLTGWTNEPDKLDNKDLHG